MIFPVFTGNDIFAECFTVCRTVDVKPHLRIEIDTGQQCRSRSLGETTNDIFFFQLRQYIFQFALDIAEYFFGCSLGEQFVRCILFREDRHIPVEVDQEDIEPGTQST